MKDGPVKVTESEVDKVTQNLQKNISSLEDSIGELRQQLSPYCCYPPTTNTVDALPVPEEVTTEYTRQLHRLTSKVNQLDRTIREIISTTAL